MILQTTKNDNGKWSARVGNFETLGWEEAAVDSNGSMEFESREEALLAMAAMLAKEVVDFRRENFALEEKVARLSGGTQ